MGGFKKTNQKFGSKKEDYLGVGSAESQVDSHIRSRCSGEMFSSACAMPITNRSAIEHTK